MDTLFTHQRNKSDDYYAIIGCNEYSNKDQIQTEYRIRALQYHPDKNLNDPEAIIRFKQLQEAKNVLCDDVQRKAYDYWRQSHITVPWKTWQAINERIRPTFHWMITKKEPMIENAQMNKQQEKKETMNRKLKDSNSQWKSTNDYLRKFRNYEI